MNTNDEKTPAAPHSPGDPGGEYPHEDEIDLADLIAVLYRRRRLIVVVTLIFALAATGMVTGSRLILPEKYTARAVVEIGEIAVDKSGNGFNFEKVESLAESEAHIRDIGNVVIKNMQKTGANGEKPQGPGFSLKDNFTIEYNDKGSNLELQLNASHNSEALSFLNRVTREFVHNHNRIFDRYREDILSKIQDISSLRRKKIDLEIDGLKSNINKVKREYDIRKIERQNSVQELQSSVESKLLKKSMINKKLELLGNEKEKLKQQVRRANENYDRLMASKLNSNASSKDSGAVSLLLFNSEIHQIRSYVDKFETRLWFGIPEKQNELKTERKNINLTINKLQGSLALEKKKLDQLQAEQQDEIKSIQQKIQEKQIRKQNSELAAKKNKTALENMMATNVVLPAQFSDEPANGASLKLAVVLGLFAGLFIGIFSAFLMEFWKNNKEKIASI